jgi:hypothetical protein
VAPPSSPATFVGKQTKIETFYIKSLCFLILILNPVLKFRKDLPNVRIVEKKVDGQNGLFCSVLVSIFLLSFSFWSVCVGLCLYWFGFLCCWMFLNGGEFFGYDDFVMLVKWT